MDSVHFAVLTGTSPYAQDAFTEAVAARFELIKGTEPFTERTEPDSRTGFGHCYDGNRCRPASLGWRTAQACGEGEATPLYGLHSGHPALIAGGFYDAEISEGWHEAARSEYYYRYEKDWGEF